MDSVEVQEFLLSATATNDSILFETDKIFDKNGDPNNSSQMSSSQSMYYSINDDTLSNQLADDLQRMERTLTELAEEDESQRTIERSVIRNSKNNTMDDESFQQTFPLKTMFPNHPMRSQCSTPKLELPVPKKTPQATASAAVLPELKLSASLAIPDLVLPLTTVLQKIEKKKVTIVEEVENKENVQEEQPPLKKTNLRKSLKPRDVPVVQVKKPTLRKSMIPSAPTTATAIAKEPQQGARPSLMASRRSTRMSVVPTTFKSSRFTIGFGGRTGKLNSPSAIKKSPKSKKIGTVTKSGVSRMTISAAAAVTAKPTAGSEPPPVLDEGQAKKRMSRIPPPHPAPAAQSRKSTAAPSSTTITSNPRPVFACTVCKKSFHLKSTLLTHQKMHATTTTGATAAASTGSSSSGHFKCQFCDKDFEKEIGLRNHMERYCEKVPVAEKRKLNGSHNRTRTTSAETTTTAARDRSKRDKSTAGGHSRLESTSSSVGSSVSHTEQSLHVPPATTTGPFGGAIVKKESAQQQSQPPPASGLSPRKPIKSISQPHSGMKFTANKPIKCFHCKITFNKYVDFHTHVEQMHPQPVGSPVGVVVAGKGGREGEEEGNGDLMN